MAKKVVYVRSFKGVSKKTNKEYQSLTLAEIREDGRAFIKDFFVSPELALDFVFGDVVQCKFEESDYFGGVPRIVSVTLVEETPYV